MRIIYLIFNFSKKIFFRTLDSLLGQANLEHARGRTKQAMSYLFEVTKNCFSIII